MGTQGESYLTKAPEALITEEHERIKITNSDYNTIFEIKDALRKDNCKYKVRAENCNGFDEEWVELVVLGRPARPEGPLEVSNVTATGCKLRWKAPLDDGGKPIQEYNIELLCPKTKKWIKKGKVAGDKFPLFFDVDGLDEGEEYLFRVSAVNELGESDPLEADQAIKAKNPFGLPDPPVKVELCDWDVDHMDLQWGFPPSDGGAPILNYKIEMRNAKEEEWHEVGESDGPKKFYQQSGLTKGEKYSFRVRTVNKAGKSEPSEPTPYAVAKP